MEASRPNELLTIHLDLRYCPDTEFTLRAHGVEYPVRRHTEATLASAAASNPAIALIPPERRAELTHYAENVALYTDAVGLVTVVFPSSDPEALLPELATIARHV